MARSKRSTKLDTRSARLTLPVEVRHLDPIQPGRYIIYQRPKSKAAGSWLARWFDLTTKKQRQARLGTADDYTEADGIEVLTYSQAQAKARKWFDMRADEAHLVSEGVGRKIGPFTVADAMEAYLDAMDRAGKKSAKDARASSGLHILPELGDVDMEKLTRLRLEKWRDALAASPRTKKLRKRPLPKHPRKPVKEVKPVPPPKTADEKRARKSTANRVLSTLKAALTYAKTRSLVSCSDDAWRNTKPFRSVDEARQNYMTPEEQQRLLNAIKDGDSRRLVYGALLTGCRYGELARMKVRDFDGASGTVLIQENKGGKPRRALLTMEGRAFFEAITVGRGPFETLFTREAFEDQRRLDPETREPIQKVQRAWRPSEQKRVMTDACDAAKLPRMGFHQLRHSYASALVAAGMPLAYVAQLTGHADTRILEKHYAHLAPSDLSRSLEALAPKLGISNVSVEALRIAKTGA